MYKNKHISIVLLYYSFHLNPLTSPEHFLPITYFDHIYGCGSAPPPPPPPPSKNSVNIKQYIRINGGCKIMTNHHICTKN